MSEAFFAPAIWLIIALNTIALDNQKVNLYESNYRQIRMSIATLTPHTALQGEKEYIDIDHVRISPIRKIN